MGGEPSYPRHLRVAETHDDGCPGGWARCGFNQSLFPYQRHRDQNGGYSANVLLDRTDDPLVIACVQEMEREQSRALEYMHERMEDARR